MKKLFSQPLGIVSYGVAIPSLCILATELEKGQEKEKSGIPQSLGVAQKTVPDIDEDTTTLSVAAAHQALERWQGDREAIGALFIGSESHPYAVKPTGTMVKAALSLSTSMALADLQFACKAGTQSLQIGAAYLGAGMTQNALAIGADTAQSKPGDVLEFTAGAGAAAYILGTNNILAELLHTSSVVTDTPDFWRRPRQPYPEHAGRFSGEPAYFKHVAMATKQVLSLSEMSVEDIDYCVFHTPNAKFPTLIAKKLGFSPEQIAPSLVVRDIGNTYAAASLLALSAVLDQAPEDKTILVTSYGSGSGADSFIFKTTKALVEARKNWTESIAQQISKLKPVSYQKYLKNTQQTH